MLHPPSHVGYKDVSAFAVLNCLHMMLHTYAIEFALGTREISKKHFNGGSRNLYED